MESGWYCARGENEFGPVSLGFLQQLASRGELQRSDLIWREGMPDWVAASKLPQLTFPIQSRPSPAPSRRASPVVRRGPRRNLEKHAGSQNHWRRPSRPASVSVVITLYLVGGALTLLGALLVQTAFNRMGIADFYRRKPGLQLVVPLLVASGIVNFGVGLALLSARPWARILAMVYSSLVVLGALVNLTGGMAQNNTQALAAMLFQIVGNVFIVILFSGRRVREWFAWKTGQGRQRSSRSARPASRGCMGGRRRFR